MVVRKMLERLIKAGHDVASAEGACGSVARERQGPVGPAALLEVGPAQPGTLGRLWPEVVLRGGGPLRGGA